ncbi:DUF5803 family protein [Methanoregula sp.]|uniref:DUF5803 family protein n=1 Tax=Methanoregula sp. TaxID=2052170 RepID=UPI0035621CB1
MGALSADYQIFPNGTAYRASVDIAEVSRYEFAETGFMGENVPVTVGNVNLSGNCSPCSYNWSRPWGQVPAITFPKGNYTVTYIAPLKNNNLQATFTKPYLVNVSVPAEFDVRNPLLAGISSGANVTRLTDNSTTISWNKSYSFDLRFYSKGQEELLYMFLQFLGIIALVLLLPFIIGMRKQG